MRILHVTPHLPPDQAANALLPVHLGARAADAGDEPSYLAHPPRVSGKVTLPGAVTWVGSHRESPPLARTLRFAALAGAIRIARAASPLIASADVVHVHSNGLLSEIAALIAGWHRKPVILTLYGTEIWHYRPRLWPDLFTRAYRRAAHVTFYSQGLADRAQELGLGRRGTSVIYPPVAERFVFADAAARAEARAALSIRSRHLLVNVKRLHPLAGQRHLIDAMGEVIRTHPDTRLVICGEGELRGELQARAQAAGVAAHVTFTGLIDNTLVARYCAAADVFVLPSLLEALPTVALEALACGTPVVTADNPGGVELNDLFGVDVGVVPRENSEALARAIVDHLERKQRTRASTREIIERDLRPAAVAARFRALYEQAVEQRAAA